MPSFVIPCLIFKQRPDAVAPSFALFHSAAGDVLRWAAIRRRAEDPRGPQRRLSRAKILAIARFLRQDTRNVIPPAVIVTLRAEPQNIVEINIAGQQSPGLHLLHLDFADDPPGGPPGPRPGLVIDGQHRLYGIAERDQAFQVPVIALLNVDDIETAFQFLVINNKVTRVSTDLIRTLALDYEEGALSERLKAARLTLKENLRYVGIIDSDEGSPFRGHLTLETHAGDEAVRFVPAAAIENSIALIQEERVPGLDAEDALCSFFYAIWAPIKTRWRELWTRESKLMHKVSIVAVTSFMTKALVARFDLASLDVGDPSAVQRSVEELLVTQTPEFWLREWTVVISDARAVRDAIVEALTRISRNMRAGLAWHEDVDLVGSA